MSIDWVIASFICHEYKYNMSFDWGSIKDALRFGRLIGDIQ